MIFIDLVSILHVDKIWVQIVKNFEMRTPRWSVISNTPGRGVERGRGVQKGQIFADAFIDGPLLNVLKLAWRKSNI